MVFNALKKKALKKAIAQAQLTALDPDYDYTFTTVGVVLEKREIVALEKMQQSLQKIGVKLENIDVLVYNAGGLVKNKRAESFHISDFNNSGTTDKKEICNFIEKPYDLLISYYTKDTAPLLWMTAQSKARFKVGISSIISKVNHFTLEVTTMDAKQNIENLIKYINNFKKVIT